MKYNLRFFNYDPSGHDKQHCFASVTSEHVPDAGNYVFISDDIVVEEFDICESSIYKVVYRVFCYGGSDNSLDDLSSVEVVVKPSNK